MGEDSRSAKLVLDWRRAGWASGSSHETSAIAVQRSIRVTGIVAPDKLLELSGLGSVDSVESARKNPQQWKRRPAGRTPRQ
jgi:hypothetical protein